MIGEAGDVAARTRQARDDALSDRIVEQAKTIGNGAGRLLEGRDHRRAAGDDEVGRRRRQLRDIGLNASDVAAGKSMLDLDVAALHPSQRLELLPKGGDAGARLRIAFGVVRAGTRRAAPALSAARAPPAATLPPRRRAA